jgi:hypothetical protein
MIKTQLVQLFSLSKKIKKLKEKKKQHVEERGRGSLKLKREIWFKSWAKIEFKL